MIKNLDKVLKNHTVWVGGVEVNDYYLTKKEAEDLAFKYESKGYDDIIIEKVQKNY